MMPHKIQVLVQSKRTYRPDFYDHAIRSVPLLMSDGTAAEVLRNHPSEPG